MERLAGLACGRILLPGGWADGTSVRFSPDGRIAAVEPGLDPALPRADGPVIPGMPNLHSHAFQRAMAGLAERAGPAEDSFWTWRDTMYGFVRRLTPEDAQSIAALLYMEMLTQGYTAVAEFHYLHHAPDGTPYADRAEMTNRIIAAADTAGIGLTLLPVLYAHGGFGGQPAADGQRRFLNTPGGLRAILDAATRTMAGRTGWRTGLALHSLRAVTADEMAAALDGLPPGTPVHIHIAEQTAEVDACVAWSGRRPVDWLLDHAPVSPDWCLVHATHMTADETAAVARCGAVAGLCPTTEANLGDGLFPAPAFLAHGGRFGIGSDSHISVSPTEDLRLLEYGQRLAARQRNILRPPGEEASIGAGLYRAALAGGTQALGRPGTPGIAVGQPADLVILDPDDPKLMGRDGDALLDAHIFAGSGHGVRGVVAAGCAVVRDGRHVRHDAITAAYRRALERLTG